MGFEYPPKPETFNWEEEMRNESGVLRSLASGRKAKLLLVCTLGLGLFAGSMAFPKDTEARGRSSFGFSRIWNNFMEEVKRPIKEDLEAKKTENRLHRQDIETKEKAKYAAGRARALAQIESGMRVKGSAESVNEDFLRGFNDEWEREYNRRDRARDRAIKEAGKARGLKNYQENKGIY